MSSMRSYPEKKGGDCKWSPVGHSFFARIYLVTVMAKKKRKLKNHGILNFLIWPSVMVKHYDQLEGLDYRYNLD